MKKFEVEFRRTSYVICTVEAKDSMQAQYLALEEMEKNNPNDDAVWEIESVEEVREVKDE
jgi:hypothetical protein